MELELYELGEIKEALRNRLHMLREGGGLDFNYHKQVEALYEKVCQAYEVRLSGKNSRLPTQPEL